MRPYASVLLKMLLSDHKCWKQSTGWKGDTELEDPIIICTCSPLFVEVEKLVNEVGQISVTAMSMGWVRSILGNHCSD